MGVVWLAAIVTEDSKGARMTLKHYLPAAHYTFTQARDYLDAYVSALDAVIDGAVRKVTLSQAVDLAGLKTAPLPGADVEEKLTIGYSTAAEEFIDGKWRQARKSRRWQHTIPTWRRDLTMLWVNDRRIADRDQPEVLNFLKHFYDPGAPYVHPVTDDHGIHVTAADRTEFKFSRSRTAKRES